MGGAGQPKDRCDDCGEHMSRCECKKVSKKTVLPGKTYLDDVAPDKKKEHKKCSLCGGRGGGWSGGRPGIIGGQVWHACFACAGTGKELIKKEPESVIDIFTTSGFHEELSGLLNKYSIDNYANVPDCILANYVIGCILNLDAIKAEKVKP